MKKNLTRTLSSFVFILLFFFTSIFLGQGQVYAKTITPVKSKSKTSTHIVSHISKKKIVKKTSKTSKKVVAKHSAKGVSKILCTTNCPLINASTGF